MRKKLTHAAPAVVAIAVMVAAGAVMVRADAAGDATLITGDRVTATTVSPPVTAGSTTSTVDPDAVETFLGLWSDAENVAAWEAFQAEQARADAEAAAAEARRQAAIAAQTTTTSSPPPPPPPPAVPPPVYSPSGGLPPFLVCVRERESRGNYGAVNPTSGAGGAYQFMPVTWVNTVNHAGRPDLAGVLPQYASPGDQDAMAIHLYNWQGPSPWAGPGC